MTEFPTPSPALVPLAVCGDDRGSLIAIEGGRDVPFDIARVYYIFGTEPGVVRGHHAHRALRQMLICVAGSCAVTLDDGRARTRYLLDRPDRGLLVSAMTWREMGEFSSGAVLLVLADQHYDEADYIRDYGTFLAAVGRPA